MIWRYTTFKRYILPLIDNKWRAGRDILKTMNAKHNENMGYGRFYIYMARLVKEEPILTEDWKDEYGPVRMFRRDHIQEMINHLDSIPRPNL